MSDLVGNHIVGFPTRRPAHMDASQMATTLEKRYVFFFLILVIIPPAFMPTCIYFSLCHTSVHMFVSSFVNLFLRS